MKKRLLHGTRKQRVPQPEWVTDMKSLLIICAVALLVQSSPVWSQEALPPLKKQPTEEAVLAEHLDALNHCDWNRLLAQYPDDFQMNLPGGQIVKGREAAGKLFAGFCKDPKEGGLKGITFRAENSVAHFFLQTSTANPAFTRSAATKSGHCGSCSGNSRTQNTSLALSAVVHSRRMLLIG